MEGIRLDTADTHPTSPVEEYQHPATGTKPVRWLGRRLARKHRIVGLPVPKFRLKPTKHNKTHPVIACLHQSSMAMRHHPDLLRCESPHANASVLRWPGGTWSRASVESTSCSFNLRPLGENIWLGVYLYYDYKSSAKKFETREFTNYYVNIQYCKDQWGKLYIGIYIYIWYLACNYCHWKNQDTVLVQIRCRLIRTVLGLDGRYRPPSRVLLVLGEEFQDSLIFRIAMVVRGTRIIAWVLFITILYYSIIFYR